MSVDITKEVDSSQPEQKMVNVAEDTAKLSEPKQFEIEAHKNDFGLDNMVFTKEPYKFSKDKMTAIVKAVKLLITDGAEGIKPLPTLRYRKDIRVSAKNGYIYINKVDSNKTLVEWARIGIFDANAKDCILEIYSHDSKNWSDSGKGTLPACLKQADSIYAEYLPKPIPRSYNENIGVELTDEEKDKLNEALSVSPYEFSKEEMSKILKDTAELVEVLPNLKDRTGFSRRKNCIIFHRLVDGKNGSKWAQIRINDKDCKDCELFILKSGCPAISFAKGALDECLESANAVNRLYILETE